MEAAGWPEPAEKSEKAMDAKTSTQSMIKSFKYFPTVVFQYDVPDADTLNAELLKAIYDERDRDQKGIARSNYTELGGWHSQNNLHKKAEYKKLTDHIRTLTQRLSADLTYHEDYELRVGTMWSIINPKGSSNRSHVHPGCLWSGVYYIQAPENCGRIEFVDPRTVQIMTQPRYNPDVSRSRDTWYKARILPVPGRMLIFPAWLYHSVEPNLTKAEGRESERVIISFNLNQHKA